jgi:hypothetical protein
VYMGLTIATQTPIWSRGFHCPGMLRSNGMPTVL